MCVCYIRMEESLRRKKGAHLLFILVHPTSTCSFIKEFRLICGLVGGGRQKCYCMLVNYIFLDFFFFCFKREEQ